MINIAIDGYSGCGKSTLARDLAQALDYRFIDSGALYRALTVLVLKQNGDFSDRIEKVVESKPRLTFESGSNHMFINGVNFEKAIRGADVAGMVSAVAKDIRVREYLKGVQAELILNKGVVMEGRDIASVIMPDAELKLFITATLEARVERRLKQLIEFGEAQSHAQIESNLLSRDKQDINRSTAPLKLVKDAVAIDTTLLTRAEQLNLVLALVTPLTKPDQLLPFLNNHRVK